MKQIYYRIDVLENIATNILKDYDLSLINGTPRATPIEDIVEDKFGLNIEYQYIRNDGRILGEMIFEDGYTGVYNRELRKYVSTFFTAGTVLIDGRLCDEPGNTNTARLRFTLSHELVHFVLHKNLYIGTKNIVAYTETSDNIIERQANYLGSAFLMPRGQVKKCFYQTRQNYSRSNDIISKMAEIFEVSKQAMKIKLENNNLI